MRGGVHPGTLGGADRAGDVQVLARVGEHPVAVRQGRVLATSFHPEVGGDDRLHRLFLDMVTSGGSPSAGRAT